ncbi:nuclear transport factor 2 family protein [Pseudovibrio ascidiaceicola]|uniref:nuclear transport factor 2 family protein n=1 Tax=Pseudovibrio ascidiaceicola TaxID=285279 RepID=UPI003D35C4E4
MRSQDQIQKLINQYSFTLDSGDLKGFAALFKEASWHFDSSDPVHGSKDLYDQVLTRVILYEDGTPRTRHMTTNLDIRVDEEAGRAECQRYVVVVQQADDFPLQVIYSGEYFDEFIRQPNGEWRYSKLTISKPFFGDLSRHLLSRLI